MTKHKTTSDALKILGRRDDPKMCALIGDQRLHVYVAEEIYRRREAAGLTHAQLAQLVGTRQRVISRLEDADNGGHSLNMLRRIAEALDTDVQSFLPKRETRAGRRTVAVR